MTFDLILLGCLLFFTIATLYSTVGHAGASGYLAVMALLAFPSQEIKATSLILNILVASIASYRYLKAGYFDKRVFLYFAAFSLPLAFAGGYFKVDDEVFKLIAGIFLLLSAVLILIRVFQPLRQEYTVRTVRWWQAGIIGSVVGYISGVIGVGGGIFLSPILMLYRWASPRHVSGISAMFILVNSIIALVGYAPNIKQAPANIGFWIGAVVAGGFLGSYLGTKKINITGIYIFLAIVLTTAGVKMIFF
ncbi:MAG: sulfite exporter TauE/SafE family protein [Runella sp.]